MFGLLYRSLLIADVSKILTLIDQLITGLEVFGLLAKIRKHGKVMEPLFTLQGAANFVLTSGILLDHLSVECSPEGSNKKVLEIDVNKFFCDYIQEVASREGTVPMSPIDILLLVNVCCNVPEGYISLHSRLLYPLPFCCFLCIFRNVNVQIDYAVTCIFSFCWIKAQY